MSVVNTNVKALFAQEASRVNELKMNKSMERLSTGLRINSAKDDAAGLAITNNMTSQIRGMAVAVRNANDGISMSQTAEGAYGEVENMLQRIRELAVQAANGAMSDDDRESLQLEVDELITQIDKVADTTNHNNIKLLDGSARDVVLQVGTKEGDTMAIGFDSAKAKDLGNIERTMLQSVGGTWSDDEAFDAFAAGNLILNGVDVGASLASDDTASWTDPADATVAPGSASAIAKAAAINRVAEFSGVYAKALETTVHGTEMSNTAVAEGTITINGYTTGTINTTTDSAESRARVVSAINAISGQTGVTAVDSNDDGLGVVLVASDGRNITHSFTQSTGTFDGTTTGLGAAASTIGTYGLYTLDGRDIVVEHALGATTGNMGLAVGTYEADTAIMTTNERSGSVAYGSAPSDGDAGVLSGDTLVINGIAIDAALDADDTLSANGDDSQSKKSSAIAIAAAINKKTDMHGVTAVAERNVLRGSSALTTPVAITGMNINGIQVLADNSAFDDYDIGDIVALINSKSEQTGVVASDFQGALELVAEDGRNISIDVGGAAAADFGLDGVTIGTDGDGGASVTHYASIRLVSDSTFTVAAGSEGTGNFEALGFREGTFGGSGDGLQVSQIDVSTIVGAGEALTAVDAAIDQISAAQAKAGAFQNRLDYVVSNLSEASQNMSASRSRILDADYATETTELARAQIIQQAATAMLAQANQSAQGVLALLQ